MTAARMRDREIRRHMERRPLAPVGQKMPGRESCVKCGYCICNCGVTIKADAAIKFTPCAKRWAGHLLGQMQGEGPTLLAAHQMKLVVLGGEQASPPTMHPAYETLSPEVEEKLFGTVAVPPADRGIQYVDGNAQYVAYDSSGSVTREELLQMKRELREELLRDERPPRREADGLCTRCRTYCVDCTTDIKTTSR
jgi:ferredoxin